MQVSQMTKTYLKFFAFAVIAGFVAYLSDKDVAQLTWPLIQGALIAGVIKALGAFVATQKGLPMSARYRLGASALRVHVKLDMAGIHIDETLSGLDAADVLHQAKRKVAKKLGWFKGGFVLSLSDIAFAQQCQSKYESAKNMPHSTPVQTPQAFLDWGVNYKLCEVLV